MRNRNSSFAPSDLSGLRYAVNDKKRQLDASAELSKLGIDLGRPEDWPEDRAGMLALRNKARAAINALKESVDRTRAETITDSVLDAIDYAGNVIALISNMLDREEMDGIAGRSSGGDSAGWRNARGESLVVLNRGERLADHVRTENKGFGFGEFIRAMALGTSDPRIQAALGEGAIGTGGATVPDYLSTSLIDRLRNKSVTLRAGAQTVLLETETTAIARITGDAVGGWRLENAAITESDPSFDRVVFTARSLAVLVKVSRELLEDSVNLNDAMLNIFSQSLAQTLDVAALVGSGTAPEPTGIWNTDGVGDLTAAPLTYDYLLDGNTALSVANSAAPTAIVMNPTDQRVLQGLKDTTGQPLRAPQAIETIPYLPTNGIPVKKALMGDFTQLMIGVRSDLRIELLKELFAGNHQYAFVAHLRADVAVAHPESFVKLPIT